MMNSKLFWKSKTVQGIALVVLTILIRYSATKGWLGADMVSLTESYLGELFELLGIGGAAYGFYGRVVTKGENLTMQKTQD